jgi:hypothetical protein
MDEEDPGKRKGEKLSTQLPNFQADHRNLKPMMKSTSGSL